MSNHEVTRVREVVSLLRAHFTEKTISLEGSTVDSFYSFEQAALWEREAGSENSPGPRSR